jgi:hypothetical protein
MQPIATYSEVRFDGARTFTLLPDRVMIRGKQWPQSEFEMTVALKLLDPIPDRLWYRNQHFTWGMWMAIAGFTACTVSIRGLHLTFAALAPGLLATLGMTGVLLMLATRRKVEFVCFKNDSGIVILNLARAGKSAGQLDAFIAALTQQIRQIKEAA